MPIDLCSNVAMAYVTFWRGTTIVLIQVVVSVHDYFIKAVVGHASKNLSIGCTVPIIRHPAIGTTVSIAIYDHIIEGPCSPYGVNSSLHKVLYLQGRAEAIWL